MVASVPLIAIVAMVAFIRIVRIQKNNIVFATALSYIFDFKRYRGRFSCFDCDCCDDLVHSHRSHMTNI